jgi:hypothetical protein
VGDTSFVVTPHPLAESGWPYRRTLFPSHQ